MLLPSFLIFEKFVRFRRRGRSNEANMSAPGGKPDVGVFVPERFCDEGDDIKIDWHQLWGVMCWCSFEGSEFIRQTSFTCCPLCCTAHQRVVGDSRQGNPPQAGRQYTLPDTAANPSVRLLPVLLPCRTVYDYVDDNLAEAMDDMERELREVLHLQLGRTGYHTAAAAAASNCFERSSSLARLSPSTTDTLSMKSPAFRSIVVN